MRRYIHYVTQYDSHSAGQRNTHYLCHLMNLAGYPSFLYFYEMKFDLKIDKTKLVCNPNWNTPLLIGEPTKEDIVIMGDAFTNVYPFPQCQTVRYFGFLPSATACGYWGGSLIHKKDLVLCHPRNRGEVQQYWRRPVLDDQIFDFPSIEPNLFYPETKTIESCYYFGKGERIYNNTENIHLPKDSFHIEQTRPASRKGLANLLNHSKILYVFDKETAIRQEAILAGCKVFYLYDHDKIMEFTDPNPQILVQDETKDMVFAHKYVQVVNRFFGKEKQ